MYYLILDFRENAEFEIKGLNPAKTSYIGDDNFIEFIGVQVLNIQLKTLSAHCITHASP